MGDNECCTIAYPCEENQGRCEEDYECLGSLVCGMDNCVGDTFDDDDDCCESNPSLPGLRTLAFEYSILFLGTAKRICDGSTDDGYGSCCTADNPCSLGEGDCDNAEDCEEGLTCGSNNCVGDNFSSTHDCCEC